MPLQVGRLLQLALVALAFLLLSSSQFFTPAFAVSSQGAGAPPTELDIKTVYAPDNAASLRKTKIGDTISVHYVRSLSKPLQRSVTPTPNQLTL